MNEAFQSCHFDYRLGVNDNGANTFFNKQMGGGKILSPTIKLPNILKKRTLWVVARCDPAFPFTLRSRIIFKLAGTKIVEFPMDGFGGNATTFNGLAAALNVQGLINLDAVELDNGGIGALHIADLLSITGFNVGTLTTPMFAAAVPHPFFCAADELTWEVDLVVSGAGNSVFYCIAIRSEEVPSGATQAHAVLTGAP
jgi:hypothetical protein